MSQKPAFIVRSPDADQRLMMLGLPTVLELRSAGAAGLASYLGTPRLAPRIAAGQSMRNDTVAALREALESTWRADCDGNLEPTIHRASGVRLIVLSGDEDTGSDHVDPLSRHPRGERGRIYVDRNQMTIDGLQRGAAEPSSDRPTGDLEWALVHFVDKVRRELRLEVSLPRSLDDDQRVDGWHERILLDPLGFDDPLVGRRWGNNPPANDLEVPVERRRSV